MRVEEAVECVCVGGGDLRVDNLPMLIDLRRSQPVIPMRVRPFRLQLVFEELPRQRREREGEGKPRHGSTRLGKSHPKPGK
jgi:hypothetical protein